MDNRSDHPLISVVIPAHNEERRISKALDGLLIQSVKPYEVIVVDNHSSDRTRQIARAFTMKFRKEKIKYRILSENKLGSAFARNKGFYHVKSPIIASMDADIVPRPDWVKNIRKHFRTYDSVAVSGITIITDSSRFVRIVSTLNWYKYLTMMLRFIFGFQTITTANAGIRSDIFRAISGFNTDYVLPDQLDDTELSSRLCKRGSIRIDTDMRVDGSFRRYQPFTKAITSSLRRLHSWIQISKNFRK